MEEQPVHLPGIGIKPHASLRRHAEVAVLAFLAVLLSGLPLVWIKGQPKYETEAVVQVAPRYMKTLKDDNELDFQSNSQYRQFVQQQISTLLRDDILKDAIRTTEKTPLNQRWTMPAKQSAKASAGCVRRSR